MYSSQEGKMWESSPLGSYGLRHSLHETRQHRRRLLFPPVQADKLPLWQVPLDAVRGGVALFAEAFDERLGLFDIREAHEPAPQFDAPVLAVNAAASLRGAVDGIAPVLLVEQRGE